MTNLIDDDDNNLMPINGNSLLKSELKSRLSKIGVILDTNQHPKSYYVEMYNALIKLPEKRLKIKSILDTDTKANLQKSLTKNKRKRDEPKEAQINKFQPKNVSLIMKKNGSQPTGEKSGKEKEGKYEGEDNACRGTGERNLSFDAFKSKIEENLNYYKKKSKEVIGGDILERIFKIEGNVQCEKVESINDPPEQNPKSSEQTGANIDQPFESSAKSIKITRIPLSISKHTYQEEDEGDNFQLEQAARFKNFARQTYNSNQEEEDCQMEQVQRPQKITSLFHNSNQEEDIQMEEIQLQNVNAAAYNSDKQEEEDIQIKTIQHPQKETIGYQTCPQENPGSIEDHEKDQKIEEQCISSSDHSSEIYCRNNQILLNAKKTQQQDFTISCENPRNPTMEGLNPEVAGSSACIKQMFNRINSNKSSEQQSNLYVSRSLSAPNLRREQSTLSKHSVKSVTVYIKLPAVSDFTQNEIASSEALSLLKYKNSFLDALYYILGGTFAVGSVVYLYSNFPLDQIASSLLMKLISPKAIAFYIIISTFTILVALIKNFVDNKKYKRLAHEDYQILKNIINNMKEDPEFVGQFQSRFIKDRSEVHKIGEWKYMKKVFPRLKELIEQENVLYESEVIISEQLHHIWKLNNRS